MYAPVWGSIGGKGSRTGKQASAHTGAPAWFALFNSALTLSINWRRIFGCCASITASISITFVGSDIGKQRGTQMHETNDNVRTTAKFRTP